MLIKLIMHHKHYLPRNLLLVRRSVGRGAVQRLPCDNLLNFWPLLLQVALLLLPHVTKH
jgi:hypothetical protein